jgi:hypothetical protein
MAAENEPGVVPMITYADEPPPWIGWPMSSTSASG